MRVRERCSGRPVHENGVQVVLPYALALVVLGRWLAGVHSRRCRCCSAGADLVAVNEDLKTNQRQQAMCETNAAEVKARLEVVRARLCASRDCVR